MKDSEAIKKLVGADLSGCEVAEVTEVYQVNEDGKKVQKGRVFRDYVLAQAFRDSLKDTMYYHTAVIYALISGDIAVALDGLGVYTLCDEVALKNELRDKASNRLTPAQKKLLGL